MARTKTNIQNDTKHVEHHDAKDVCYMNKYGSCHMWCYVKSVRSTNKDRHCIALLQCMK